MCKPLTLLGGTALGLIASVVAEPPAGEIESPRRLMASVGEGFRRVQTAHFSVVHDVSDERIRLLIDHLEATYDAALAFSHKHGLARAVPPKLLDVIIFNRREDFATYLAELGLGGGRVGGVYDPQKDVSVFSNIDQHPDLAVVTRRIEQTESEMHRSDDQPSSDAAPNKRRQELREELSALRLKRDAIVEDFNRLILRHETTHQVFYHLGIHLRGADQPHWLVEGLACQLEMALDQSGGAVPTINNARLADFRDALRLPLWAQNIPDEAYQAVCREGRVLPLIHLLASAEPWAGGGTTAAFRYAQAWALVYYLNREFPEAFVRYVRRLGERQPGQGTDSDRELADFQSAFGAPDREFERAWIDYTLSLPVNRTSGDR